MSHGTVLFVPTPTRFLQCDHRDHDDLLQSEIYGDSGSGYPFSNFLSFTGLSILIVPSVLSNEHLQKIPLMYLDRGTILSRYTLWSVFWPSVLLHDNSPLERAAPICHLGMYGKLCD